VPHTNKHQGIESEQRRTEGVSNSLETHNHRHCLPRQHPSPPPHTASSDSQHTPPQAARPPLPLPHPHATHLQSSSVPGSR
jgi:hypothetical protein